MKKRERELLLYLEDRQVSYCGQVNTINMTPKDFSAAERWHDEGFITFGRIGESDDLPGRYTHWCRLSEDAWRKAQRLRRKRAAKTFGKGWKPATQSNRF
jgi:hypothetical protein